MSEDISKNILGDARDAIAHINKNILGDAVGQVTESAVPEDEITKCSICNVKIDSEEPAILTMGGFGYPRYLCDECAADLDEASLGRDESCIAAAMDRIGKKMLVSDPDRQTYTTVTGLMALAHDRALKIRDGSYDFSLDEADDGFDEIPDELAETEEDKEKDRIDEENAKKFDKIFNYVLIGVCVVFVGFIIWKITSTFLLK